MSAIASTSTPVIDALMGAISCLSREEKEVLVERVQEEIIADEDDIPEWHLEILEEREKLRAAGLDESIPAEEAFRQIRERFQQEQMKS
ncbi:MAG: addiction module protein [Verrucomicrobiota bacterium]